MPALIEVDSATERLRDGALAVLAVIYVLPVVWVLPPSVNVALTASLTVFSACLRTVGRTNEAELVSKKVLHVLRIIIDRCFLDIHRETCSAALETIRDIRQRVGSCTFMLAVHLTCVQLHS